MSQLKEACVDAEGKFHSVLILIPIRLGVEFNMIYAPALKVRTFNPLSNIKHVILI
mgnify:CR=1 FL=1